MCKHKYPPFYYMLAARCTCAPPQGFVRHNSVPPSMAWMSGAWNQPPAMTATVQKDDNVDTHYYTHFPTIDLTSAYTCQLFPLHFRASLSVACANSEERTNATQHDRSRWSGCRGGGEENKQIAGEARGPWLLTKCPPDVVGLLPTPHLMASCASTLPVGVKC